MPETDNPFAKESIRVIQNTPFQNLDVEKLVRILKKSVLWVILIMAVTNTLAYLYIRWTKPVYQSTSQLKLDIKSEATALELGSINELVEKQNLNNLYGEIELITSDLFFNKVLDAIDLEISYFSLGNVLSYEWYRKRSPYKVTQYEIKDTFFYGFPFNIEIRNGSSFTLSYTLKGNTVSNTYRFGEKINHEGFEFQIDIDEDFNPNREKQYFFIINSRDDQIEYIRRSIEVLPHNLNANTISVSFKDFDRRKAYDIVNTIDSLYLHYSKEEKSLANKNRIKWLNGELRNIEKRLGNFEGYFEEFAISNKTVDLNKDLSNTIKKIIEIDSQRYFHVQRVDDLGKLLTKVEGETDSEMIGGHSEGFPASLQEQIKVLADKIKERKNLSLSYNESTFALQKRKEEIDYLKTIVIEKINGLKGFHEQELNDLADKKSKLEHNFMSLPGKRIEYNKARRFYSLYEELYLALMKSKAEFEIADAGTVTDFKILSPATFPDEPLSPQKSIIKGIGIMAGILFSLLFIAVRYVVNDKISNVNELEKSVSSVILGIIPRYSDKIETSLVVGANSKSSISEALRTIRTNIEFMFAGKKKKVISVTSTVGSEGKTFVSVNLGGIIALSNRKVVLVDLDMRKPKLHMAVSGENTNKGVSTVLINKTTLEESIRHTRLEGLDYIPAGPMPPNPSELLLSEAFGEMVDQLRERYDMVVLDTPPVGIVTDASLVMKKADLPIYVFRAEYSKKSFTKTLERLVQTNKFNNIAVILNSLQSFRDHKYGYGYYEDKGKKKRSFFKRILGKG